MKLAFALALTAAFATPALAAQSRPANPVEARYSKAYATCLATPSGMTDPGMRECTGAEIAIQDRRLNLTYQQALKVMSAGQKGRLQTAQRAWVAFRDADCPVLYDVNGGSMERQMELDCILRMTVERTIILEGYVHYGSE